MTAYQRQLKAKIRRLETQLESNSANLLNARHQLAVWESQGAHAIHHLGHKGDTAADLFDAVQNVAHITYGIDQIEEHDHLERRGFAEVLVALVRSLGRALGHVAVDDWRHVLEPLTGPLRLQVMRLGGVARQARLAARPRDGACEGPEQNTP